MVQITLTAELAAIIEACIGENVEVLAPGGRRFVMRPQTSIVGRKVPNTPRADWTASQSKAVGELRTDLNDGDSGPTESDVTPGQLIEQLERLGRGPKTPDLQ